MDCDQLRDPLVIDVAPLSGRRVPIVRHSRSIFGFYQRAGIVSPISLIGKDTGMKVGLAFALFPLIVTAVPVSAQSPCSECFKAVEQELKKCLDKVTSQEDKNSCAEERDEQAEACDQGECKIERENKKTDTQKERSQ